METISGTIPSNSGAPASSTEVQATPAATPTQSAAATQGAETPPAQAATPDFRTSIPESYREKNYLRDVKSIDDVFKMLDNAQGLIGKQGKAMPAEDAPAEEWAKYYATNGRPEAADKYEFQRDEGVNVDPAIDTAVKGLMFEAGLSGRQAKMIQSGYDKMMSEHMGAKHKEIVTQFDTFAKEYFGDDQKVEAGLKQSAELLDQLIPASAKKFLPYLSNESAMVIAAVMDQVRSKYVGEDKTRLNQGGGSGQVADVASMRARGLELMKSPAYKDGTHPNHAAVVAEVNKLYAGLPNS